MNDVLNAKDLYKRTLPSVHPTTSVTVHRHTYSMDRIFIIFTIVICIQLIDYKVLVYKIWQLSKHIQINKSIYFNQNAAAAF